MNENWVPRRMFVGRLLKAALALIVSLVLVGGSGALATDPNSYCAEHDNLVSSLTGNPHHEQLVLDLMDEMLGQGHHLELFMNHGEGFRHSYTLIRSVLGIKRTCIVTAGLVEQIYVDNRHRAHVVLKDENDPDTFDVVIGKALYVIIRRTGDAKLRQYFMQVFGTEAPVVSFGRISYSRR